MWERRDSVKIKRIDAYKLGMYTLSVLGVRGKAVTKEGQAGGSGIARVGRTRLVVRMGIYVVLGGHENCSIGMRVRGLLYSSYLPATITVAVSPFSQFSVDELFSSFSASSRKKEDISFSSGLVYLPS